MKKGRHYLKIMMIALPGRWIWSLIFNDADLWPSGMKIFVGCGFNSCVLLAASMQWELQHCFKMTLGANLLVFHGKLQMLYWSGFIKCAPTLVKTHCRILSKNLTIIITHLLQDNQRSNLNLVLAALSASARIFARVHSLWFA